MQLIVGEPVAYHGFEEILYYASSIGMKRIDDFTIATLLDSTKIKAIKKVGTSVRVSLYGHNAEIHDKITQVEGSHSRTEQAPKVLNNEKIPTTIAVIIMRENEDYIQQIKAYVNSLNYLYKGYDTIRITSPYLNKHALTRIDVSQKRCYTKPEFRI